MSPRPGGASPLASAQIAATPTSPTACETTSTVRTWARREATRRRSRRCPRTSPRGARGRPLPSGPRLSPRRRGGSRPGRRAGSRGRAPRPPPSGGAAIVVGGDRVRAAPRAPRDRAPPHAPPRAAPRGERAPGASPLSSAGMTGLARLPHAAHVVEQGRREQQVGAEPRVELCCLAAERRDPTVCSSSPPAYPWCPSAPAAGAAASPLVPPGPEPPRYGRGQPGVGDLRRRGTRGTLRARRRRGDPGRRTTPGRPRLPRGAHLHLEAPSNARPARARAPRRPRRSAGRGARRPPRRGPRSARWGRRARPRDTAFPCARRAAACARPRTPRRPCGPRRAPRSSAIGVSVGSAVATSVRSARSGTPTRARR